MAHTSVYPPLHPSVCPKKATLVFDVAFITQFSKYNLITIMNLLKYKLFKVLLVTCVDSEIIKHKGTFITSKYVLVEKEYFNDFFNLIGI